MRYRERVTVIEVGMRDGIQIEPRFIPTAQKIALANLITDAGVQVQEVTSFVHPRAVPQLADAAEVVAGIRRSPGVRFGALVPNLRGAGRAVSAGIDEIRYVVMSTETFNQKNVQMSVRESLAQLPALRELCRTGTRPVRLIGSLGTSFGCPYEGDVPERRVLDLVAEFVAAGVDGITLADTTGMANPVQVVRLVSALRERWPDLEVVLHFHNTRGMGLANVLAGMEAGVTIFEASIGGLGGCPFAPRATGNICTEDTVHMLHAMGIETGIDLEALIEAARAMQDALGHELPGQVMKAGPVRR